MVNESPYLNADQLAKYLGMKRPTIYRKWRKWATEGLRVFLIGDSPRFRTQDVDSWMEKKCVAIKKLTQICVLLLSLIVIHEASADVKDIITREAKLAGLNPSFVLDIAKAESSLDPSKVSRDGHHSIGLFQFTPETWAWATKKVYGHSLKIEFAHDPEISAKVACWFLKWIQTVLKKEGHYSEALVIYAFNAGIGTVRRSHYITPRTHTNQIYRSYYESQRIAR